MYEDVARIYQKQKHELANVLQAGAAASFVALACCYKLVCSAAGKRYTKGQRPTIFKRLKGCENLSEDTMRKLDEAREMALPFGVKIEKLTFKIHKMNRNFDTIGEQIDRLESLAAGLNIPLPGTMHVDQLKSILPDIAEKLKAAYVAETGDNPWG